MDFGGIFKNHKGLLQELQQAFCFWTLMRAG